MAKKTVIKRSMDHARDSSMKNIMDKRYSDEAFNLIKELKEERGIPYTKIAELMSEKGWVSGRGSKLSQPVITRFMSLRGYNIFKHKTNKVEQISGNSRTEIYSSDSDLERDIIEVLQGDFPEATKRRLIAALVKDN